MKYLEALLLLLRLKNMLFGNADDDCRCSAVHKLAVVAADEAEIVAIIEAVAAGYNDTVHFHPIRPGSGHFPANKLLAAVRSILSPKEARVIAQMGWCDQASLPLTVNRQTCTRPYVRWSCVDIMARRGQAFKFCGMRQQKAPPDAPDFTQALSCRMAPHGAKAGEPATSAPGCRLHQCWRQFYGPVPCAPSGSGEAGSSAGNY